MLWFNKKLSLLSLSSLNILVRKGSVRGVLGECVRGVLGVCVRGVLGVCEGCAGGVC